MESDILELLHAGPKSVREVRSKVKGGNERIGESIKRLEAESKISRVGNRWAVTNGTSSRG